MKELRKVFSLALLMGLLLSPGIVPSANAVLKAFSPNPVALPDGTTVPGLPAWIQDQNGVSIGPCLDPVNCGLLADPGFAPALPLSFPTNFPEIVFYFDSSPDDAIFPDGTIASFINFLEVNFVTAAGIVTPRTPGAVGVVFQRQRLRVKPPAGGTVTGIWNVTTPWGATTPFDASGCPTAATCTIGGGFDFPAPAGAAGNTLAVNATAMIDSAGLFPGSMSTFLKSVPAPPAGFLGTGGPAAAFTGAPALGLNQYTISGPPGTQTITSLVGLIGQIFGMDVKPVANNFGPLLVTTPATTTAPVTVTVTNPDTVNPMTIAAAPNGLVLAGPNAADFTIVTDGCSAVTLPVPAGTCTFTVAYAPKALAPTEAANRTATVTINAATPVGLPAGLLTLSGTAQYPVTATADANGAITDAAGAALPANQNAGAAVTYKVAPKPMFQVKDIMVGGVAQNITAIKPANPTQPVNFVAPPLTAPQAISATFMPSGNLTASGTLGVADAVKGLRIAVGLTTPTATEKSAMDVAPLGADSRPAGDGNQDLKDVLLILRRVVGSMTW